MTQRAQTLATSIRQDFANVMEICTPYLRYSVLRISIPPLPRFLTASSFRGILNCPINHHQLLPSGPSLFMHTRLSRAVDEKPFILKNKLSLSHFSLYCIVWRSFLFQHSSLVTLSVHFSCTPTFGENLLTDLCTNQLRPSLTPV